jgi:hypothetical protein
MGKSKTETVTIRHSLLVFWMLINHQDCRFQLDDTRCSALYHSIVPLHNLQTMPDVFYRLGIPLATPHIPHHLSSVQNFPLNMPFKKSILAYLSSGLLCNPDDK